MDDIPQQPTRVHLFATCLIETIRPQAGLAVVDFLERLGLTVEYPSGQTCCGQPAFNTGSWGNARAMARQTLDVLGATEGPIVVPSGSCAAMIRRHYPELLAGDAVYGPLAEAVAGRVYEFAEFVGEESPDFADYAEGTRGDSAGPRVKVAYHPSCHLVRELGVRDAPRALLAAAEGVEVVDLPDAEACCGFGGLFAIKMSGISSAMLARKLDAIERSGVQVVTGCDASCLLHIAGGLHRRGSPVAVKHLAELLAP
ncbi:(Fe-S)-binding protein [Promineifilum sp.]|uniref:(Fe-S)-binding protein n=1 Tax=Promineifilum sp. TaxID=2664178 RepID=UPI0035AD8C46